MKKFFSLIAAAFIATAIIQTDADAQASSPRYGTASNQNQTYSNLKLQYNKVNDVALQDTFVVPISAFRTHIDITLLDTVCIYVPIVARNGDQLTVTVANTAGANHFVKFTGYRANAIPFEVGSGGLTVAMTSAKNAVINFIFNGAKWIEVSRMVQ